MTEPIVSFQNVSKQFGDLTVLDNLCMEVSQGERVAIIGPSGSGKTTVLRTLMTLEDVTGGMIRVEGTPITHMQRNGAWVPANARHQRSLRGTIGMVFQHFNLFPHMTALQNCIEAPIGVFGMSRKDAQIRALDLLEKVGLADRAGHYPNQLSGGQQQRVAIARALAMRPKILLLDEITSALDPELVGEVLEVVRNLAAEHALTIIMVTHQLEFVRAFSDRVCFFYKGRIHEQGVPDQLFAHPSDERTRLFLRSVRRDLEPC